VQLHRYFVTYSIEFCRYDPLCCFSVSVYIVRHDSVRKLLDTTSNIRRQWILRVETRWKWSFGNFVPKKEMLTWEFELARRTFSTGSIEVTHPVWSEMQHAICKHKKRAVNSLNNFSIITSLSLSSWKTNYESTRFIFSNVTNLLIQLHIDESCFL